MKAVGLTQYLPIHDPSSLMDVTLPTPEPGERDLLVRVEAISVNPVDCKVRMSETRNYRSRAARARLGCRRRGVGIHVYSLDVYDPRHTTTARTSEQSGEPY